MSASLFHYPPEFVQFRQEVGLDERLAPLPRLVYYLAATLHLADLVRTQLDRGHVVCDRYLASPLSLLISESAIEETEACRLTASFEPYLKIPDLILLLTANHAVASTRISDRSLESGIVTPVTRRVLESAEFFHRREAALRRLAMKLGPLVELDTSNLSDEEMCRAVWNLLAPRLGFLGTES
jgi:thymidylate kinase